MREVRHEAVVRNFEAEVRGVLDFLGLEWIRLSSGSPRSAGRRPNPSDVQLARGLNADGVGQWRRYESQIAPVLPILEKWVGEFGY